MVIRRWLMAIGDVAVCIYGLAMGAAHLRA